MWIIPLLLIGAVGLYITTAEERRDIVDVIVRAVSRVLILLKSGTGPDAFDESLRARTRWPVVTVSLIAANVVIFVFVTGFGGSSDPAMLARSGASAGPLTTNGEWWRIVTAAFVHAGLLHLLINVVGLVQVGIVIERLFGHAALAATYLAAAAFGTLVNLATNPVDVTTSSSEAVFGIYGMFLAAWIWGTLRRSSVSIPLRYVRRLAPAAGLFFLYHLIAGGLGRPAGVAILTGVIFGLLLSPGVAVRPPAARKVAIPAVAAALIAIVVAIPFRGIADVRPEIARVVELEKRTAGTFDAAVERFKTGRTSAAKLAELIERSIMPELHSTRERLKALRGVPRQHEHLVAAADEYLQLRDQSWRLRLSAFQQGNTRMLREADKTERASLAAFETIESVVQ